jgi:biopolymer transport protein ExbD
MRRHRQPQFIASEASFSEMNSTPLIDVMLVLLILCILSIPLATHKIPINLPAGPPPSEQPIIHRLAMDNAGGIYWDGEAVTLVDLPDRLDALRKLPNGQLEINTAGDARYEEFDTMMAVVKNAKVTSVGFVGHHQFVSALDR